MISVPIWSSSPAALAKDLSIRYLKKKYEASGRFWESSVTALTTSSAAEVKNCRRPLLSVTTRKT
jgi:hypothetical protein